MKTIVLVTFTLQGGGAERFVLTLAEAYREMGYKVHIICFKSQIDYQLPQGIQYHYLNYQSFRTIPKGILRYRIFAKIFDRYIKKNIGSPQLILSNLQEVDHVLHYSKLANIVYVLHNTLSIEYHLTTKGFTQEYHLTTKGFTQQARVLNKLYQNHPLVGVSQGVVDDYKKHIGSHPNIRAIHNPIDQKQITDKGLLFLPDLPQRYIVHVGKFKPQKDHKTLIKAYAKTTKKIPLVLLGSGALIDECKALAKDLNIAEKVIFMGFQENPYPYIKNASFMVLSSQFEGFGIVIGEALALGTPVISTDCQSGPRELLPPKNLVPVGDISALADKISVAMIEPKKYHSAFNHNLLPKIVAKKYLDILG